MQAEFAAKMPATNANAGRVDASLAKNFFMGFVSPLSVVF